MAALGTIRKRGVILVCIISFGLFAFIAEEAFRSCDSAKNNERTQLFDDVEFHKLYLTRC